MQSSRQIESIAADWLARRDRGNWSEADDAELDAWLDASTAHRISYLRLEAAWSDANRLQALGAGATAPPAPLPRRSLSRVSSLALAASVLLGAVISVGLYISADPDSYYRTAVGVIESVPLPDGSTVTLNTDTEVRVALSGNERRVDLARGEALFEVSANPEHPFVVLAGEQRVVAIGTRFSVRRDARGLRVVVTEGKVRVEDAAESAERPFPTELPAGTLARSNSAGVLVREVSTDELEGFLSWRNGFITFRDTPLADAIDEFNRYNARQIDIYDPTVADIRIGGRFRATNIDAFLSLLEEGFAVRVEARGDRLVLHASESAEDQSSRSSSSGG